VYVCVKLADPAAAPDPVASSANTCEPGAEAAACANTCEPGMEAAASSTPASQARMQQPRAPTPGAEAAAPGSNTCELGEGTLPAEAGTASRHISKLDKVAGPTAATAGASVIAALQDEGASAASVRRHLAAPGGTWRP
jgi:hypothetical protein